MDSLDTQALFARNAAQVANRDWVHSASARGLPSEDNPNVGVETGTILLIVAVIGIIVIVYFFLTGNENKKEEKFVKLKQPLPKEILESRVFGNPGNPTSGNPIYFGHPWMSGQMTSKERIWAAITDMSSTESL